MSMNFSEFKKLLGADPWNRDPDFLRARNSSPEFERAAAEAEAFERKLQRALHTAAPDDLLEDIAGIGLHAVKHRRWVPLAMAASLILAVGAAAIFYKQTHTVIDTRTYVAEHFALDGMDLIARATAPVPEQDIRAVLSSLHAHAGPQLSERMRFIKFCPTPHGTGAHMVISTDQGLVTVIFMPDNKVRDGQMVDFNGMQAYLVALEHGSAAIIGRPSQHVAQLRTIVTSSLKTGDAQV